MTKIGTTLPASGPSPSAASEAARAPATPAGVLPRDPGQRLEALFEPGTLAPIPAAERSGALAAVGRIGQVTAVAFANDPRTQGGAMGAAGCAVITAAYREAMRRGAP